MLSSAKFDFLVKQHKDKIFLFYSMIDAPKADLSMYIVPVSKLDSIKVLPHYNSCGG